MTRIYLIRHAEAEGNLYRRAQGHYDSNVTALGRRQIAALAERFRGERIDALWSSDLHRTQSTAAAIVRYHPELTLHLSPALREIDVGVWEDLPWGNITAQWPEQMDFFTNDPARWSIPGGEPYAEVQARMRKAVLELAEAYEGKTLAVVSHGLAIRALLCSVYGIPSERIAELPYGDNTSVTCVTVEDGAIAVAWQNDASHLEAAGLSTFARQHFRKERTPPARLEPLDPHAESELYARCYAATWMQSHGDLAGYSPVIYQRTAEAHARIDPRCVMKLWQGDEFAGVVELDPERGSDEGAGWVSLVYVEPALRSRRLGVQLIGHASSFFRRRGRTSLRLHVSATNTDAIAFYETVGFRRIGVTQGVGGTLYLMEMDITPRVLRPEEI